MLPGEAGIFLMQADRVFDRAWGAEQVRDHRVEIVDRAETVAAEFQRIGHSTKPDFAAVKHVLPVMAALRRAVRHDHLGDRGAIDDRPPSSLMRIADCMENQALTAVEADAEVPVLPTDLVTVHAIAGACWLHDVERCGRRPKRGQHVGVEVERCARDRNVVARGFEMVIDAQDLQCAQVDQRVQPLDGVGVVVVQWESAHPDEAVEDTSALLLFEAELPTVHGSMHMLSTSASRPRRRSAS